MTELPSSPAFTNPSPASTPLGGPRGVFALWFGLQRRVTRQAYLLSGLGLMAFKYGVDVVAAWMVTGVIWKPWEYVVPLLVLREQSIRSAPEWFLWALVIWTLPFLWVGVSMSVRRAADAGWSPWVGVSFLLPFVNYGAMLALATVPSRAEAAAWPGPAPTPVVEAHLRSALLGVAAGVVIALSAVGLSVFVFGSYGAVLFLGAPFVMGALSAWIHNRGHARSAGSTILVAGLTVMLSGFAVLLFAFEGVLCISMAAPPAIVTAVFGAVIGRSIAIAGPQTKGAAAGAVLLVAALPVLAGAEPLLQRTPATELLTTVEIDAPPDVVWQHVTSFSELDSPSEWFFRVGVAYPIRARLEGEGVGAVRHCEFSTGAFVEPITAWDPPSRLAFDVESQPPSMKEWSPYRHVAAPHLDGYIRSKRGEFRLIELDGGRTRLEGRTWYELEMFPHDYWALWSDALIHSIHGRVLEHIKGLAEADHRGRP